MIETQPITKDNVPSVVEEPPLKDRRSCLRRGCGFTVVVTLFILAVLLIIVLFFQKPRPANLATLPPNFPSNVPLYKFVDRTVINYYPGEKKDRLLERIARTAPEPQKWRDWKKIISAPGTRRDIDTIEIVWQNLDASLRETETFYRRNLNTQGFSVGVLEREQNRLALIFQKDGVTGSLHIEEPGRRGVSTVVLRVDFKK